MQDDYNWMDDMLNDESKSDINPDVMMDIDLIDPFDFNDIVYPVEHENKLEFEELVASIEENGLKQPIEVWQNPDNPKRYICISGHRRRRAILKLIEEKGREDLRKVKVTISEYKTIEEAKIGCIDGNGYRDKDDYSIMKEIEVYEQYEQSLKERGESVPGSVRAKIASRTNIKESQVGKYQKINKKADETVKEAIKKDLISIEAASQLVDLKKTDQQKFIKKREEEQISNAEIIEEVKTIKATETPDAKSKAPKTVKIDVNKNLKNAETAISRMKKANVFSEEMESKLITIEKLLIELKDWVQENNQ